MSRTSKKKQTDTTPKRIVLTLGGAAAALLLLAASGGFVYARAYRGKILPGVSVANINLGGLTVQAASARLAGALAVYERTAVRINIGSGVLTPQLSELGLRFDIDATLADAYGTGRPAQWRSFFAMPVFARGDDDGLVLRVDEKRLESYRTDIETRFSTRPIEPLLRTVNGVPTVIPGRDGRTVRFTTRHRDLLQRAAALETLALTAETVPVSPTLTTAELEESAKELVRLTSQPAALTFERRSYPVSTDQLSDWLEVDPNIVNPARDRGPSFIAINADRAEGFLETLEKDVFIEPKKSIGFASREHGEYAYKNAEGRVLDRPGTLFNLLAALQSGATTAAVATSVAEPIFEMQTSVAPKAAGKVISVDLTRQIAFAHEDGELIFWTHASTGKAGYKTPTGEWKVYAKTARQVMDGPGYYLPNVKWVLPYNGDYTLHGTYWHTNFGKPMSHGCANLSEQDAKWFYDWAEVGTPVVIYESEK